MKASMSTFEMKDKVEYVYIDALFPSSEFDMKVFVPPKHHKTPGLKSYLVFEE